VPCRPFCRIGDNSRNSGALANGVVRPFHEGGGAGCPRA
jgi:hypothetical protein